MVDLHPIKSLFLVVSCNSSPHFPTIFWTYYSHWYPRSNSPCFHRRWCEDPSSPFQTLAGRQLGLTSQVGLFLARTIGSSVPSCEGSWEAQGLFLLDESGWRVQRFFLVFFLEKDRKEMKRCWPFWTSWANSWLFRVSWLSNSRLFYLIDQDWKCHYILVGFAPSRQIGWSGPETTSTAKYIGLGIPCKLCLSWSLKTISVPPDVKHLKLRPTQDRLGRHLWEPFQSNVEFRAWTQPVPPRQRRTKDAEHPCSCKCWGRDL